MAQLRTERGTRLHSKLLHGLHKSGLIDGRLLVQAVLGYKIVEILQNHIGSNLPVVSLDDAHLRVNTGELEVPNSRTKLIEGDSTGVFLIDGREHFPQEITGDVKVWCKVSIICKNSGP